jgi:hypothetical protein
MLDLGEEVHYFMIIYQLLKLSNAEYDTVG